MGEEKTRTFTVIWRFDNTDFASEYYSSGQISSRLTEATLSREEESWF